MKIGISASLLLTLFAACLPACTTAPTTASATAPAQPRITVLYDAFGKVGGLQKDWGYSALVEVGGKRILFDTGDNPDILGANARALGADLAHLDFVVMSHRHGDHMGGMEYLLQVNPKVKIYAPKENFGVYGAALPSKFYRKNDKLPSYLRYYDGAPPETMVFGSAWPRANIQLIDQTTEIAPGIHLIALVSDKPTTLELKELSLAIRTDDGLVLVVGCSHPGIDKVVEAARAAAGATVIEFEASLKALRGATQGTPEIEPRLQGAAAAWRQMQATAARAETKEGRLELAASSEAVLEAFETLTDQLERSLPVLLGPAGGR